MLWRTCGLYEPPEQSISFWFELLFGYVVLLQPLEQCPPVGGGTPIL